MDYEFIKQQYAERISVGDEIALYSDEEDGTPSGRYTVARFDPADDGEVGVTLVGMGRLEGTISMITMGVKQLP